MALERFKTGSPDFLRKGNAIVDALNGGRVNDSGDIAAQTHPDGTQSLFRKPQSSLNGITNIRLMEVEVCIGGVTQTVNILIGDPSG